MVKIHIKFPSKNPPGVTETTSNHADADACDADADIDEQWKNLGWLGYIGDYTTQLYRDYNTPV